MADAILTQAELKSQLHYDAQTGIFIRINSQYRTDRLNVEAGSLHRNGYRDIRVNKVLYKAHRLAWLYMTGEWPKFEIDHINGVRDDNRFSNLRDVTKFGNQQNQRKLRKDNSTGFMGVGYHKLVGKYFAYITVNKKRITLGWFTCQILASEAYMNAKRELHLTCTI